MLDGDGKNCDGDDSNGEDGDASATSFFLIFFPSQERKTIKRVSVVLQILCLNQQTYMNTYIHKHTCILAFTHTYNTYKYII